MEKVFLVWLALLVSGSVFAQNTAQPTCTQHANVGYCAYTGTVRQVYANDSGLILMYFEVAMATNAEDGLNYDGNITAHIAGAYRYADNPQYANFLYSTLLAAKSSGAIVQIQMRGVSNPGGTGYPLIDRIWLN